MRPTSSGLTAAANLPPEAASGAPRRDRRLPVLLLLLAVVAGCQSVESRVEIVSFKNPRQTARFSERFDRVSYAGNAHRNWDFVFEILPTTISVVRADSTPSSTTAPASLDEPAEVLMSQLLHIQVFWQPLPGRTAIESTQTNATILYCLFTGKDVIAYEGAGFIFFEKTFDGKSIKGRIESSDLVPTQFINAPADIFGPCRLEGTFVAQEDRGHVVSVLRELRSRLQPASQPSQPPTPTSAD